MHSASIATTRHMRQACFATLFSMRASLILTASEHCGKRNLERIKKVVWKTSSQSAHLRACQAYEWNMKYYSKSKFAWGWGYVREWPASPAIAQTQPSPHLLGCACAVSWFESELWKASSKMNRRIILCLLLTIQFYCPGGEVIRISGEQNVSLRR